MNKKLYVGIATVMIIAASVLAYMLFHNSPVKTPEDVSVSDSGNTVPKSTDQPVIVTGTVECLKPKDTSGAQAASCAIGLQQDDGTSYALYSQDPTVTGSIPTGQRIQATGTLSKDTSPYDIVGTINLTAVQRL